MDIVVINLDRTPRKLAEFERANRGLIAFERFAAIDGLTVRNETLAADGILHADLQYTPGRRLRPLPHRALAARCRDGKAADDLRGRRPLNKEFTRFAGEAVAKFAGQFDLILWGWNFDSVLVFDLWGISSCAAIFNPNQMLDAVERFKTVNFIPTLYGLQRAYGTVCYTVSPKGAATLLQKALPLRPIEVFFPGLKKNMPNTGLDVVLSSLYPTIVALVSFPPLVLTKHERGRSTTLLTTPKE